MNSEIVSSDEESDTDLRDKLLVHNNRNTWQNEPPIERRRDASNIVRQNPGPTSDAVKPTPVETWNLFFTDEILAAILRYSQKRLSLCNLIFNLLWSSLKRISLFCISEMLTTIKKSL